MHIVFWGKNVKFLFKNTEGHRVVPFYCPSPAGATPTAYALNSIP